MESGKRTELGRCNRTRVFDG